MDLPECWIKVAVIVKIVGIAAGIGQCRRYQTDARMPVSKIIQCRNMGIYDPAWYRNPVLDWHAESRNADAQLWYLI